MSELLPECVHYRCGGCACRCHLPLQRPCRGCGARITKDDFWWYHDDGSRWCGADGRFERRLDPDAPAPPLEGGDWGY